MKAKKALAVIMALSIAGATVPVTSHAADMADVITFTFSDDGIQADKDDEAYEIENTKLEIKESGTYRVSGSCANGNIVVKKSVTDVVLILDGITLTSETTAPICCNKNTNVEIVVNENTVNTLSDAAENANSENEDGEGAVIKAKSGSSLNIHGRGNLNVNGVAKNGIKGAAETDITVDEVTLWVKAENNGIASDDKVYINGGTISVFVGNEGIKAEPENTVDETTGEVTLVDTVSEGDIILNGGNITIVASGDGVQAYQDMVVNGGSVEVTAAGDGLDSNGAINISDGRVVVFGAVAGSDNVPFDCEGQLNITGGTVFGAGSSRMAVTPASAQKYITSKTSIAQGKNIVVSDNASNELFKTEACKNVNYVIYSSAELSNEGSYTITATDATIEPTATPTAIPTATPTATPTARPTTRPTATPTAVPTVAPTAVPTVAPTIAPTAVPTVAPTAVPTVAPTIVPTSEPTVVKKISAKVTAKNSSSLIIKWDKAADADYYEIYRSTSKNGTYKKIKTINNVSTTSYTNSKLTCGETYYYVVKGYKKGNNENTCVAESGATSVKVIPAKTAIKTLTSKNSKVTLNWKKISGVTGYEVYRSTSKNGTYKKIAAATTASKVSYTNKNLQTGKKYYYKIRTYKKVNGKKVYGTYSTVKSVKVK